MSIKRLKLVWWISLLTNGMFGQKESLEFRNYGIRDGLSQSSVFSIAQDNKGFLWFATSDGLNQFDGYKFKVYKNNYLNANTLSENWVARLFIDSNDELWAFSTDFVINKMDLRTQQIVRYSSGRSDSLGILPFSLIYSIKEDSHKNVWISTDAWLACYNGSRFNFFPNDPSSPNNIKGNIVNAIVEDDKHVVWFGSVQGLYYFDATGHFKRLVNEPENPTSLLSNHVINMFMDKSHNLWVLSSKGLSLYKQTSHTFVNYPFPVSTRANIWPKGYTSLIDKKDFIWIGTDKGLLRFNPKLGHYYDYQKNPHKGSLSDNMIQRIFEDKSGNIWIGTANGLNRYNALDDNFDSYVTSPQNESAYSITNIVEDKNGDIFTLGNPEFVKGSYLCYLNKSTGVLEIQTNDKCNPLSIASTFVRQPFVDKAGNLWLGSHSNGIVQYIPRNKEFECYGPNSNSSNALGGSSTLGLTEDDEGNIWIPLYDKGVDIFNPVTRKFTHLYPGAGNAKGFPSGGIYNSIARGNGTLWISSIGRGILEYNPKTGAIRRLQNDPSDPSSISSNIVNQIIIDQSGKVWIAHAHDGVDNLNPLTGKVIHYKNDPNDKNSLGNNNLWTVFIDKQGYLWVSCDGFIDRYNPSTRQFTHYKSKSSDFTGIIADKALCIFQDSKNNMWFGTSGGGISLLNAKTNKFRHWTENDGLPNNVVYGILEDEEGCLWLSTNRGLSRFDVKRNKFTNFDESDGLQSNEFNMGSYLKTKNHKLYFGGINGFNSFYPRNIKPDSLTPQSIITGLQIFNRPVAVIPPDKRNLLDKNDSSKIIRINDAIYLPFDITYSNAVTLTYREKMITIEFAGMGYSATDRITYRYKMENFDADWNDAGNRRFATYTNLPAGEYTFMVTASNASGIWNPHPTMLKIRILPPLRQTWYFFLTEGIFVIGLVIMFMRLRFRSLKHAKEELEKKVNERTHEIKDKNEELELRNIQILKQKEEIAFQAQQIKTELTAQNQTSELALLRTQINPHFLFNTLNNIYSLVYQRSDDAPAAVMKLSEIMRYMLYEATSDKVLLLNEVNYLKSFIELQLLRLKNKDFVEFNINGNIGSRNISPMLFIAFVENAFKHGVKRGVNPGIIINLEILDNKINFEVINYHRKNDSSQKDITGGIGLTNIRRRLELLYPNKAKLDIVDDEDKYHVKLTIEE